MIADRLKEFEPIFRPKSVVLIGVSADERKFGSRFLRSLQEFGFKGQLYPVNPRESEILGLKAYPSVKDIPDDIDFAAVSVPARVVPQVLEDCLEKGVKAAEIFSSGFTETGEEEGHRLELELAHIARRGIRIIGPNCFGVYCPDGGLTMLPGGDFPKESGPVAFISQSGGYATRFAHRAGGWGIRFSKVVSYGNAVDINEADLLEYFGQDPETKIITAYIEGVRDGRRFLKAVREVSPSKPVIIWKGGLTQGGGRAAYSHTGSLGVEEAIWKAFLSQSGAIGVDSLEELINTTVAFLHLPCDWGIRVGVVGGGGGISVVAADTCEREGLVVPLLDRQTQEKLRAIVPPAGTSVRNPVDVGSPVPRPEILRPVLETVASCDVDTVIVDEISLSGRRRRPPRSDQLPMILPQLTEIPVAVKRASGKLIVVVLPVEATGIDSLEMEAGRRKACSYYLAEGIPVYQSLQQAARSLANLVRYHRWVTEAT